MDNKSLTTTEETEVLPAIADNTLIAVAEQAEKRVEAMQKIKRMALKLTNPHDWVDEQGKPYLQASGAEKVARLFGISWRISEPVKEELEGGHFTYTYHGEFSLAGATIEAIGTRSSKDGFFKKYEWKGEGENRTKLELPASEIDPGDVKKSAYTNLLGNGITRLLGIRNLTYEDLKEYAGITKEQLGSVDYKKAGKAVPRSAQTTGPTQEMPQNGDPISEPQAKAIHAILKKLNITGEFEKMQKVAKVLGLTEVPSSLGKVTKKQASQIIEALQKEAEGGEG
jgi:hypothetical protein